MTRIEADYWIETAWPLAEAAEAMAGEQSSGTFLPLPGETPELKERSAARVVALEDLGPVAGPSLPGAGRADQPHRAGPRHPVLADREHGAVAAEPDRGGGGQPLRAQAVLRPPPARPPPARRLRRRQPRPAVRHRRHAAARGRRGPAADRHHRQALASGSTPQATAALVAELCAAGIDFVKDDELQGDGPACPFEARARAVMAEIDRAADRTGRKAMFAFNVTGEIDEMRRRHDLVLALGGTCVMVNLTGVGLVGRARAPPPRRAADPRPPQRLGRAQPLPVARLRLRRLGEDLAARRRRPHARQRPAQQVLRAGRQRHRLGARLPHADVRGQALHRHAGLLLRPVGGAGLGHLRRPRLRRPDLRGRRRDHGPSRRPRRRRRRPARRLGRRPRGRARRRRAPPARPRSPPRWGSSHDAGAPPGRPPGPRLVRRRLHRLRRGDGGADLRRPSRRALPRPADARGRSPASPASARVGLAGDARTRSPDWMRAELPAAFASLRALGAPLLHYKVCSTLDSAPHIGSIGAAAEIGLAPGETAPLLVAAPAIGRWQAFGTLFARAGDGIHRLDRHPTMSVHPVTPMDEADVRRHLARQTTLRPRPRRPRRPQGRPRAPPASPKSARRGAGIVALDVVDEETLAAAGAVIWQAAPGFVIGSQGVEYALTAAWRAAGLLPPPPQAETPRPRRPDRRRLRLLLAGHRRPDRPRRGRRLRGDPPRPARPRLGPPPPTPPSPPSPAAARPSSPAPAAPPIPA